MSGFMLAPTVGHDNLGTSMAGREHERRKEGIFTGYHISGTILDVTNTFVLYFLSRDRG